METSGFFPFSAMLMQNLRENGELNKSIEQVRGGKIARPRRGTAVSEGAAELFSLKGWGEEMKQPLHSERPRFGGR